MVWLNQRSVQYGQDVEELVEDQRKELSFKEKIVLHNEEVQTLQQRIAFGDEEDEDKENCLSFPAEDLKVVFSCWK